VKLISTDRLYIVPQVWLIYCGSNKSDTSETSLQQLFPASVIHYLRYLQKKRTDISLLCTYVHTYTHTHTHIYIYICFQSPIILSYNSWTWKIQYQTKQGTNTIWWLQNNKLKIYNF